MNTLTSDLLLRVLQQLRAYAVLDDGLDQGGLLESERAELLALITEIEYLL